MQLIRGLHNVNTIAHPWEDCVATVGNMDGLHIGHQHLIERVIAYSQQHRLPSVVILFEPQPREYFAPEQAPVRLMRLAEKLDLLKKNVIDYVVCLYFNRALAELSADDFVRSILVHPLQVKHLVVGDDFRFGSGRGGNIATLQRAAELAGFSVDVIQTVLLDGRRVSSTWLREALGTGDLDRVHALLGRPYTLMGRVVHGAKRGRHIGFPTANIPLKRRAAPPLTGVYAVTVEGLDERPLQGVANIGKRPTVDGTRFWLEVHLFDFDSAIYGQTLRVAFRRKLRDEQKFKSIEDLKAQITRDVSAARKYFQNR